MGLEDLKFPGMPPGGGGGISALAAMTCITFLAPKGSDKYDGAQVLRFPGFANSTPGSEVFMKLFSLPGLFDVMKPPTKNSPIDVMICKQHAPAVRKFLDEAKFPYEVAVPDMKKSIDDAEKVNNEARSKSQNNMTWTAFHTLDTINSYMKDVCKEFTEYTKCEVFGKSFENRELRAIRITTIKGFGVNPVVWVDAGLHAREWIGPAVATYFIQKLLDIAKEDEMNKIVSAIEWIIVPNMNPDGYVYTHKSDRLWRKTRSYREKDSKDCYGADPNRNFEFQWGDVGTSPDPCTDIYKGPSPASEPEVQAAQKYITKHKDQIKLYVSFHAYSQLLFTPWAYDTEPPPDRADLDKVAEKGVAELTKAGTNYSVGSPGELLYPAAGSSFDFAKGVAGIKFAYTYELRDEGKNGFLLPINEIVPTAEETFASVFAMFKEVMNYYNDTRLKGVSVPDFKKDNKKAS